MALGGNARCVAALLLKRVGRRGRGTPARHAGPDHVRDDPASTFFLPSCQQGGPRIAVRGDGWVHAEARWRGGAECMSAVAENEGLCNFEREKRRLFVYRRKRGVARE